MRLCDDLSVRVLVHAATLDWVASPAAGVARRMLYRVGEERARATSIVRYAPGSRFARHEHPGGEELLVLEGTFQDETGAIAAGTYVRNPPGTGHAPWSDEGCTLFVKLWQFSERDREQVVRRADEGTALERRPSVASSRLLFEGAGERVMVEDWQPGAEVELENTEGLELLVLSGSFTDGTDELSPLSWLRLPAGSSLRARVGAEATRVWYKAAPLAPSDVCAFDEQERTHR